MKINDLILQMDDDFIAAGMTDGLVQLLHRKKVTDRAQERETLRKTNFPYLHFTKFQSRPGDIVINAVSSKIFSLKKARDFYRILM